MTLFALACALQLIPPACDLSFELGAVERLLCIELESTASVGSSTVAPIISFADTRCDADDLDVTIRVGSRVQHLDVPLADVAIEVRPRATALLILEKLRAREIRELGPLRSFDILARSSAPARTRDPLFVLFAGAGARYVPKYDSALFGGRAGIELPFSIFIFAADAGVEVAGKRHPLGELDLGLATLGLSVRAIRAIAGRLSISLGPRLELGYVWASGRAFDSATIERSDDGAVILGGLRAGLMLAITDLVRAFLELEGAGAILGFDTLAETDRALGISGFHVSFALGVGFAI